MDYERTITRYGTNGQLNRKHAQLQAESVFSFYRKPCSDEPEFAASANFYLEDTSDIYGRINIGDYVFIGMGVVVLPGVTIANRCIIAAGAVVTKSFLEEGVVIGGNPARVIGRVSDLKEKNKYRKLMTWGMSFEEKKHYLLKNEKLFKS